MGGISRGLVFFYIFIKLGDGNKMTYREIAATLEEVDELVIPPDCVKRKLDGVVDSVPPDKGCEVLDGLMKNGMRVTAKILLIVMMPTFK